MAGTKEEKRVRYRREMGLTAKPSPILLVRFLLQPREQADEAVLILV